MPRGVITYIIVVLVTSWGCGAAVYAMQQGLPKQMAGLAALAFLPAAVVPLITVWWLHTRQSPSNPYRGLVWGPTGAYWLLCFIGLAAAAAVLGAQWALGLFQLDPEMGGYIALNHEMALEQSGKDPGTAADGMFKIIGMCTAAGSLLLGPWLGAAFGSLGTFPQYGWLGRRLLVRGRATAVSVLMLVGAAGGAAAGLMQNPQFKDTPQWALLLLYALVGAAPVPAALWALLRYRSAVLPAMLTSAYASGMTAAMPYMSDYSMWLSGPSAGLAGNVGLIVLGIALWVWQDPGGADMAVSAVANDGTPLTPEQFAAAQDYEAARRRRVSARHDS
jgi:hypothetical protein